MAQQSALVNELKLLLRERGLGYADVARRLRLSLPTIKRLFSRGGFSLQRIDDICALLNMELSDVVDRMRQRQAASTQLTRAQEQEIVADPKLFFVTWLALNQWRKEDILATYTLDERELQRLLIRLDRLKLIELQPGNRSRLLVNPNLTWIPGGPIQRHVNRQMLREFFDSDFAQRHAGFRLHGTTLSEGAMLRVKRLQENCLRDCMAVAADDAALPLAQRYGVAMVLAMRPWQYSGFAQYLRQVIQPPP